MNESDTENGDDESDIEKLSVERFRQSQIGKNVEDCFEDMLEVRVRYLILDRGQKKCIKTNEINYQTQT